MKPASNPGRFIYTDLSHEHHTVYTVDGNTTINEDR